jgi:hypothetical protein
MSYLPPKTPFNMNDSESEPDDLDDNLVNRANVDNEYLDAVVDTKLKIYEAIGEKQDAKLYADIDLEKVI